MRDLNVIINNSELGSGTYGASIGVEQIKNEIRKSQIPKLKNSKQIEFNFGSSNKIKNLDNKIAKNIKQISENYTNIVEKLNSELKLYDFNLIISGDHSSTGAYLSSFKNLYKDKTIGLIWIDAHADLHSPFTTPSGNMHGMTISIASGNDNIENQINSPDIETLKYWEQLKTQSIYNPSIKLSDLVYIGIRDIEEQEVSLINSEEISVFSCEKVNQKPKEVALEVLNYLKNVDLLFVSFDVDSLDPETVSWGTGTPVKNGIFLENALELLQYISNDNRLIAFEIVEVNPLLEKDCKSMTSATMDIIYNVVENYI